MAPNPQHVDNVDQLSSVTILGIAIVGAVLTIGAYLLVGS